MSVKTILRGGIAHAAQLTGLTAPRRRSAGLFTVITFHRILPNEDRCRYPFPGLAVTPEEFDSIIAFLSKHFDCGTLAGQHQRYLEHERCDRPLLALTFDDAQYDNHLHARPVLAHHGVKASFFAPVSAIERRESLWHDRLGFALIELLAQSDGSKEKLKRVLAEAGLSIDTSGNLIHNTVQESKRLTLDKRMRLIDSLSEATGRAAPPEFARMMTFEELAELASDGHEIGSHSMTHCMMPECDDKALDYEVAESRRRLEARIGRTVESFCYPNGNCDLRTAGAVEKAGYRRAVTTRWGHNDHRSDSFQLSRFDMEAAQMTDAKGRIVPALLAYRISGIRSGS